MVNHVDVDKRLSAVLGVGVVDHYRLPMDAAEGYRLHNPSELTATIHLGGGPSSPPGLPPTTQSPAPGTSIPAVEALFALGVQDRALRLGGGAGGAYVSVTGADQRAECFGDLDQGRMGESLLGFKGALSVLELQGGWGG